ncbi:MAG: hypothetical protein KKB39_06500, partial [Nanoarchaeota archaeon]|nr:hypothetical protein [Nanoarchaeota archaeon]
MAYTKEEIERMKKALGITDSDESGDNKDTSTDLSNLEYILMPKADTYALGVEALQNSCNVDPSNAQFMFTQDDTSRIIRPLTFEENIKARVDDYETLFDKNGNERDLEARKRLFQIGLDSCTGIAYKAKTTKFKILNECSELINIASNFNSKYLPINYRGINSIELDSSQGVYNKLLTPEQILEHP